jgi:hypothetical protein
VDELQVFQFKQKNKAPLLSAADADAVLTIINK